MEPESSDSGYTLYARSDRNGADYDYCVHLPSENSRLEMLRLFVGRRQKLGGFSPRFPLYPAETHLCGCQKKRRADVNTEPENQKENIHETQPQQICSHFALRICGHHLLSYNVGNHAWTGRRTWNRKDAKNWRVIFRRRRSLARGDAKAMRGRA